MLLSVCVLLRQQWSEIQNKALFRCVCVFYYCRTYYMRLCVFYYMGAITLVRRHRGSRDTHTRHTYGSHPWRDVGDWGLMGHVRRRRSEIRKTKTRPKGTSRGEPTHRLTRTTTPTPVTTPQTGSLPVLLRSTQKRPPPANPTRPPPTPKAPRACSKAVRGGDEGLRSRACGATFHLGPH